MVYCCINRLIEQVNLSPIYSLLTTRDIYIPKMIGALHFITGRGNMFLLRRFTKDYFFETFDRRITVR